MEWETAVAWVIGVIMVVVAIVFGAGIWLASPVVVNGVLNVSLLIVHLCGSALVAAVCAMYIWFMMKMSK